MKKLLSIAAIATLILGSCCQTKTDTVMSNITEASIIKAESTILAAQPSADKALLDKGLRQAAGLWRTEDGTEEEFISFSAENYLAAPEARKTLFDKLQTAFEVLSGTANMAYTQLSFPVILDGPELTNIDYIFGAYSPSSHFSDDMFSSKVAFITVMNFPNYTLSEKNENGVKWTRQEWAYARMGDLFTTRIPAKVSQDAAKTYSDAENYISSYNIMMGHLLNEKGERLFSEDMVLLSHWNLRDEIKSNYADVPNALEKQQMIYKVMERIACQDIPAEVINNPEYDWMPYSNKVFRDGKEVKAAPEGAVRYQHILNSFHSEENIDFYSPQLPTGILRNFEGGMEVSAEDIEALFVNLISSPQVKKVAQLIKERLGRELTPYDIWYDGFKSRSTISEDDLTAQTRKLYPTPEAFHKDMPRMLQQLGFTKEKAQWLADRIVVEGARGSGHAAGAASRQEPARLRTRIGKAGMDYKGYNIAVHEFGHNVEQTLSLYDVDNYIMNGVPNTAFTEALAFVFQKRDLKLLGYPQKVDDNTTLDIFWGAYEIMGVALVDMYTWRWLYDNKDATAEQLRDAVLRIAREVWNQYYEPVLGTHDSPILAIYSHMVDAPMYLPNYPFGHIIEFQLEEHFSTLQSDKSFADEIQRIYTLGTLTPQIWMQQAVGSRVSTDPMLAAIDRIIK